MRLKSIKEIKVTILFTSLFLLGGFIHVIIDPLDFTSCIAQIYYSSLVIIWAYTVNYRIVNRKVRRLMLIIAALFMLAIFFQMSRYRIFEYFYTLCRFFWYGYYIPVVFSPVIFLFVVLHLHLQEGEKPKRRWLLMLIPSFLLIILIVTNDFHQLIFKFNNGTSGRSGTYSYGILFYSIYVWVIIVLALSLYLAIKQCRIPSIGMKLWMPIYFAFYGILVVLSLFDIPKIGDAIVWAFIETLAMIIIGMIESCIQIGLIPANSSYSMIASLANKPFIISDKSGTQVYATETAQELFKKNENVQIHTKPIKGGYVSWAVDLSDIIMLNKEIEKATESIESRNEYLKTENSLKEEQSRLNARNNLYNQIAGIVSPQLDKIENLLNDADNDRNLAKIAFFNAYIKRRSNMELLKSDLKRFPTEELASAIRESCEYLKLCGVYSMLNITPECELSADMQLFLYETFEDVAESCLDTLEFLLVNITMRGNQPVLRMTLKSSVKDTDSLNKLISSKGGIIRFFSDNDEDEMTISVTYQEGEVIV